jgi:hypothetical protein
MKLMLKILLLCFASLLCAAKGTVLTINDEEYSLHDFYSRYPKKQWERADSLKKDKMFTDFIKRELCIFEAKKVGLQNDPDIAVKIRDRSLQILVNESYEHFVATPLISPSELDAARQNAKKELFAGHILIGHSGAYLANPPQRTIDEALLLSQQIKDEFEAGESFSVLAKKYSDDPSAKNNSGSLGWVQWGRTVPEFQRVLFGLGVDVLSPPVLTDFGYHLILVSDIRSSELQYMSDDAYESYVINVSKNSVREQLREAAVNYDAKKIDDYGVLFNLAGVELVLDAFNRNQKDGFLSESGNKDSASLLKGVGGVLCVYNGRGYGPGWFSTRLKRISSARQPRLDSADKIISALKTIILQDIAINEGFAEGVENIFTFKYKKNEVVSDLLYDAYLKLLVNSAKKPDSLDVFDYYENNKFIKYMGDERVVVREIKVSSRSVADSLVRLLDSGVNFALLAQQNSSTNPGDGGLYGPFSRRDSGSLFDAASLLGAGEYSSVLPTSKNSFSIIQLVEPASATPIDVGRVYVQIESLLIKEGQDEAKSVGVDGLLNKYTIIKNSDLLF